METVDDIQIGLTKFRADSLKYFSLFDKHIPRFENDGENKKILLLGLNNEGMMLKCCVVNSAAEYWVADQAILSETLPLIGPEYNFKFFDGNLELYNIIKNCDMKFDCIIMNPPYEGNKNLYGKITLEAKKHAYSIVCLSPYINYLSISEKKDCHRISNELAPFVKCVEAVPNGFDAAFDKKLAIIVLEDNIINPVLFDDLYFNEFKNSSLAKNISDKIKKYCLTVDSCFNHLIDYADFSKYKYKCSFVNIRGNVNPKTGNKAWDWTTIFDSVRRTNFLLNTGYCAFPFDTENECHNFIAYCDSDILMFSLFLVKKSFHNNKCNFKYLPYMNTFSKKWTDIDIANEIRLTEVELNYIHDEMKDFGWKTRNKGK